jgi:hypothetical protein
LKEFQTLNSTTFSVVLKFENSLDCSLIPTTTPLNTASDLSKFSVAEAGIIVQEQAKVEETAKKFKLKKAKRINIFFIFKKLKIKI